MMERYSIGPRHCFLYSSSRKFVESALGLGIDATYLGDERELVDELRKLLRNVDS
jgi:hypothetical protein